MAEFDIFNLGVGDIETYKPKESGGSDLYKPTADQGKDGTYRALVRFVPNPKNPSKSIVRKYIYWLEDGNGNGSYYDSPSTVGDSCPVQDLFFKLRNSDSAVDRKMSENLKRREVFYSLLQIIKDPNNPDMEGKVKVFKYGYKVKQKIDEELNPQFDTPTQVFDIFEGKNFELVITKQGGYNAYDSSKFQGKTSAMTVSGKEIENNAGDKQKVMDLLSEAPDLSAFDYKKWDDDTRNKVEGLLQQYRSPGSAKAVVSSPSTSTSAPKAEVKEKTTSVESESSDLNDFLEGLDL
jgi:hypothetical protein